MIIKEPQFTDLPHLRRIWLESFGDSQAFWHDFIHKAKPLTRCRCAWDGNVLAAALYWFECSWEGKPLAYLYGVATGKAFRGRGLCRALMADTHAYLKARGYCGVILVPGGPELFEMYEKMGYATCAYLREFDATAGEPIALRQLTAEEFAAQRQKYLPRGGVVQEGTTLDFIDAQGQFYAGENCLAVCSSQEGKLMVSELLGDADTAAGIVATLGFNEGRIRIPGNEKPFAMYHSLTDDPTAPSYFGLALD